MDISVVIPAYNRLEQLRATLQSVFDADRGTPPLSLECLVVDDGSDPPLEEQLAGVVPPPHCGLKVIRQANSGSIAARRNGLDHATGEFVQFLDSDDLIHPAKLAAHLERMRATGAELSYCDVAALRSGGTAEPQAVLPEVGTPAELFIRVQVLPHSPVFRRDALVAALRDPIIPQNRVFEPAGDTWLFFNCATQPWRVCKVPGHYAIYVSHESERHSTKWEKTGVPALALMAVFASRCPRSSDTLAARGYLGAAALQSYRRLPLRFHREYERMTLDLFRTAPRTLPLRALGGAKFATLARVLGAAGAARLLRRVQCSDYSTCQMIPRDELNTLFDRMTAYLRSPEAVATPDGARRS